ncbi:uncharacterized protein Z520_11893 [Fonsecaea multimorphosa CBS 102226]|uniref:Uncharacterized protein n=1 Tax=Fonsecaea multimorphosa CBS 102226 TaxID=1442371 RepID=A0A0D2K804_9EURO|nr:uncharacterized protein Z520_11893 [Fonsecaea multimorphosa CBS 102226]KIX92418.1 hypothetical protein Z520_11893 [Fonsecaea multimorphosa CBS 102226]
MVQPLRQELPPARDCGESASQSEDRREYPEGYPKQVDKGRNGLPVASNGSPKTSSAHDQVSNCEQLGSATLAPNKTGQSRCRGPRRILGTATGTSIGVGEDRLLDLPAQKALLEHGIRWTLASQTTTDGVAQLAYTDVVEQLERIRDTRREEGLHRCHQYINRGRVSLLNGVLGVPSVLASQPRDNCALTAQPSSAA